MELIARHTIQLVGMWGFVRGEMHEEGKREEGSSWGFNRWLASNQAWATAKNVHKTVHSPVFV